MTDDFIEQANAQKRADLNPSNTCAAINCRMLTNRFLHGGHYRLLSKELKDKLINSNFHPLVKREAIQFLAAKDGFELSGTDELELTRKYGRSDSDAI